MDYDDVWLLKPNRSTHPPKTSQKYFKVRKNSFSETFHISSPIFWKQNSPKFEMSWFIPKINTFSHNQPSRKSRESGIEKEKASERHWHDRISLFSSPRNKKGTQILYKWSSQIISHFWSLVVKEKSILFLRFVIYLCDGWVFLVPWESTNQPLSLARSLSPLII